MNVKFIAHRINSTIELSELDANFGAEIDLRECGGDIYIHHDPFVKGDSFIDYIKKYSHSTLILNIKCDAIEDKVLEIIKEFNPSIEYFFLDSAFPTIKKLSSLGEQNIALRYSEFEGLDLITSMQNKVKWVWVDCFSTFPLDSQSFKTIKRLGYKICIVSPELQGQDDKLEQYATKMVAEGIIPDAICSKVYNFKRWKHFFNFNN
jgi:hypothetical protein